MSLYAVAGEAILFGPEGPLPASQVSSGQRIQGVVAGRVRPVAVAAIGGLRRDRTYRLLTGLGDLVVPDMVPIVTDVGPQRGLAIRDRLQAGGHVQVEVVRPPTRAAPCPKRCTLPTVLGQCLASLEPGVIQLPLPLIEQDPTLGDKIRSLTSQARVATREARGERWHAFSFNADDLGQGRYYCNCHARTQLEAMRAFTAWELPGGAITSRTLLKEGTVRRRLVSLLAAQDLPYAVKWTPSYFPVEARVSVGGVAWPAFVPVTAVLEEEGDVLDIETEIPTSLVSDLAVSGFLV